MFGAKKKLIAEIQSLREENEKLCDELDCAKEVIDEYEALKKKYASLEIKNQFLRGEISELEKKVTHYEKIDRITDFESQLKSNELKQKKELNKKNREIQDLIAQNRELTSENDLLKFKITELSQNKKGSVDVVKLQNDLETYSKTNAKLSSRITDLEYEVEYYKQRTEENFQNWRKKDTENIHLRKMLKLPKNSKFKCEYTSQYKVRVTTEAGKSSLYNADIYVLNYSLYSFNETGYCMKETKECKYFLERFYWPSGGYISFNEAFSKEQNSTLQLLPDGTPKTFIGSDNKRYSISFSLDFIVEPTEAQLLQFTVKKNSLSELLKESKHLHKSLGGLLDKILRAIDDLGIDLPLQVDIVREFSSLSENYRKLEKEFKNYTKNVNEKFKSKFEKIK